MRRLLLLGLLLLTTSGCDDDDGGGGSAGEGTIRGTLRPFRSNEQSAEGGVSQSIRSPFRKSEL